MGNKDGVAKNLDVYKEELKHWAFVMREEHLPRFKNGSFDPRAKDSYYHLIRNLFTETFRAMPRILSGLFMLWLAYQLYILIRQ